ncbi:hypothetical protein [Parasitella parasitica]|uniref:Uncharacterized protein n=1 Tax=Parasitella parasitica TaxID=35722 RepID=A0A0B7N7F8_9FUNG|nr:hypothetical protein [Parasitella parasitica]
MSTLNSYFRARKSKNSSINKEKTLTSTEDENKQKFAVQAPQPVYPLLPKQTAISTTVKKTTGNKKQSQKKNQNSILNYLSSVEKPTDTKEETLPTCQIRHNIPVTHVWNLILEEFDPNQIDGSPSPSPTIEKAELCTLNDMLLSNNRRRKMDQDKQATSRCVRIRTIEPPSASVDIFCVEDYLLEDTDEDLSRPVRNKHTSKQSSLIYMEMLESLE